MYDEDCNDEDPCTKDQCIDNECSNLMLPGPCLREDWEPSFQGRPGAGVLISMHNYCRLNWTTPRYICGEVNNSDVVDFKNVQVTIALYEWSGETIKVKKNFANISGPIFFSILKPGDVSPFQIALGGHDSRTDDYKIVDVSYTETNDTPYRDFEVTWLVGGGAFGARDYVEFHELKVKNTGIRTAHDVKVYLLHRSAETIPKWVDYKYTNPKSLNPGKSSQLKFDLYRGQYGAYGLSPKVYVDTITQK
jgi:hypothetical protein